MSNEDFYLTEEQTSDVEIGHIIEDYSCFHMVANKSFIEMCGDQGLTSGSEIFISI